MTHPTPDAMATQISRLLRLRLNTGQCDLATGLRRARRRLPSKVYRSGMVIADAELRAHNPKLARQLDPSALGSAYATCHSYLTDLGKSERRKDFILHLAASVCLALLVIFGLSVAMMA